ncbi:IS3 family transposase [Paenibacillus sp. N4]|uniref:IS3 family transposase n=1 Tax=Paenibacillus vietnamensis TaxID=2590547 RepID=UPI001CD0A4AE|nr:IS3 family transposase [Paenibacillus vietnamensis]MCA0758756.1 IS3 family transposase [Paenibacillus vietnamensis]
MADQYIKQGNSAALVLRILGIAESSYYARKKRLSMPEEQPKKVRRGRPCPGYSFTADGLKVSDEQIQEWLLELVEGEESVYGYKLLAQCLWNERKLILGKHKAYRLCKELGILQKQREKKLKHPRRLPKNRLVTGPNQLWQMDIKYGYVVGVDRFFFLLSIIDVFDRAVVSYYRGPECKAKHAAQALGDALKRRLKGSEPKPAIRTDNGPQFVSELFGDMCESLNILHERIPPRTPNMNAYIESFHSIIERDLFSKKEYMTMVEAYEDVDWYMDFYNNRRMHGSLKRMSPFQFSSWVMDLKDRSKFHLAL